MRNLNDVEGKLDTKSMLEEGFLKEYSKGGAKGKTKPTARVSAGVVSASAPTVNVNTESVLMEAYEVRDGLINSFSDVKLGSALAENMKTAINKVGNIIIEMGGSADSFDPLAHVSGLGAPSLGKYASRVIENTVDSYSLGKIEGANIGDNGKSIVIAFVGMSDEGMPYKAVGTIVANETWLGNEAIDYVYTPGEGKMSVKVANQDGQWIDQSDGYAISWELFEGEAEKNIEKKAETEEEEKDLIENNVDDEINIDFPIEEK